MHSEMMMSTLSTPSGKLISVPFVHTQVMILALSYNFLLSPPSWALIISMAVF